MKIQCIVNISKTMSVSLNTIKTTFELKIINTTENMRSHCTKYYLK